MAYVATSLGQHATVRMHSARIITVAMRATDGSGMISAATIPIAAMSARPTNGWLGALSNFICWAFRLSSLYNASRNPEPLSRRR
jgi:hypothetical protein